MIVTFENPQVTALTAEELSGSDGRTIRGMAVPWDTVGTVSDGTRVRFAADALDASSKPIVTLGHEGPPIGRTVANTSTPAGLETTVRVSKVRDGDDALTLAADGVLGMFSVGVNPTSFHYDDTGVMVVDAGDWHHTALLPFGAFPQAVVTAVAASQPTQQIPIMSDTLTTDTPPADVAATEPPAPRPAVVAVNTPTRPHTPPMNLARVASLVAAANRGEITADAVRAELAAAWTNVVTTDVAGVVQPAYRAEINGLISSSTPLLNALSQGTLPAGGMTIEYPEWATLPTTGIQATEKTEIVSTPATITLKSKPIKTIAGGNDISLQAVERSSPSFLEAYLRAMSADWAKQAELYAITELLAVAEAVPPATVTPPNSQFLANVQALIGALDPATTPEGPLFLAMSPNVANALITIPQNQGPAFWSGNVNFGSMPTDADGGGLNMFADRNLPADTMLLGSRQGATWHESGPRDIRVVDVSLLGLDVGVYGYVCITIEYPGAFAKMDVTP